MKYLNQVRKYGTVAAASAGLMVISQSSHAAIAAGDLTAPLGAITTDANTVFTAVLPVMLTVLALVIGYKLVKRFVNGI